MILDYRHLKDNLVRIDEDFSILKRLYMENKLNNITENEETHSISSIISTIYDGIHINVKLYNDKVPNSSVMSIFPSVSTMERLTEAIVDDKVNGSLIENIWKGEKSWTIEIDVRVFDKKLNLSEREITAMLMHEIGHIIYSNYVPNKISTVIKVKLLQWSHVDKKIIGDIGFRKLLSVPLGVILFKDRNPNNLKEEYAADKVVVKLGYGAELAMAMKKMAIYYSTLNKSKVPADKELAMSVDFVREMIDNLKKRQYKVIRRHFLTAATLTPSITFKDRIKDVDVLLGKSQNNLSVATEFFNEDYLNNLLDKYIKESEEEVMEEFTLFTKKMKKIDPSDFDYIALQIEDIKSTDDKLMLVTYIYNKLDIVDYYIKLINYNDPKYIVPHSKDSLNQMRNTLLKLKDSVIAKKLPEISYNVTINGFPAGYEG